MRIAFFQDTYHPCTNGVVVSTDLFIEELRRRGHETLLIVPRHPDWDAPTPDGVHLVDAVATDGVYPGSSLGKFWKGAVGDALRAFGPDLMHSMTEFTLGHWMASYFRNKLGLKRVHTFHTLWTEYLFYAPFLPQALTQPLFRYVAPRSVHKRFDSIIVPSETMRDVVHGDWGVRGHVDVVPTGFRLERFAGGDGARFRARHHIQDGQRVVLYLGRLGEEKNTGQVIDTFVELRRRGEKDLRLVIAGDGPDAYVKKLRRKAERAGLRDVVWTGFITGQEWLDCYHAADVVLMPSVTETQGLVVTEALAMGRPLVTVNVMGPAAQMKGERGGLFAEPNPRDFADKTQRLLHDDVLWERKRREALEIAEGCSIEHRTEQLEAIYERTLGRRGTIFVGPSVNVPAVRAVKSA
jgi:glycosyltransferase involved in cell wall biosynthesis